MPFKHNGNWYTYVRWRIGDKSGRVRRKIGPRKADAVAAEAKIRAAIADGTFIPEGERTLTQPEAVSFGQAMGIRASGLVANTIAAGVVACLGWALGGLLPKK